MRVCRARTGPLELAILLSHLRALAAGLASRAAHFVVLEEDAADGAESTALQAALRSAGFVSAECVAAPAHRRAPALPERARPCAFQALTRES